MGDCIYQPVLLDNEISGDCGEKSVTEAGALKDKTNDWSNKMDTQREPTTGTSKRPIRRIAKGKKLTYAE